MYLIALAFVVVAFLHASVGFGGALTYTAILVESGIHWQLVPPLSLACNVVVTAGGVFHFARAGHLDLRFAAPLVAVSIPAAFLGGYIELDQQRFQAILGGALLFAGALLLADKRWQFSGGTQPGAGTGVILVLGISLGALAGLTGIGGAIYLGPVLHFFRLADAKTVAASCSLFSLLNSVAGLAGQLTKLGGEAGVLLDVAYLVLPLAVLVGGQIGSRAGARWLPASPIRRLTGLVITIVAVRLIWPS